MFDHVGEKIKGLAATVFFFEAAACVVGGIALMAADDELILWGMLLLFLGPLVSLVFAWFLYAFGELVESSKETAENTRKMVTLLTTENKKQTVTPSSQTQDSAGETSVPAPHSWRCNHCGKMRSGTHYCEHCGKQ